VTQRVFRLLLAACAAALLYGSLYPLEFRDFPTWPTLRYRIAYTRGVYLDIVLNVLVYAPLGVLAALSFRKWPPRLATWLAISAMSLAIEYTQLWIRTRDGNLRDFYANAFGALLGVLAGGWLLKRLRVESVAKLFRRDRAAWLLLAVWTFWQLFPFMPSARIGKLQSLIALWKTPSFSFLEMGDALSTGMALAFLTSSAAAPWAWLGIAATLLTRGFIAGHSLPLPVFLFTLAAFAACRRYRVPATLAASLMITWIALRELHPFHFSRVAAPFHWGLLSAVLEAERISVIRTLAGKFFLYTSALWLLRAAGLRLSIAAPLFACLLALCEWLQRYLPGRTPELTDVLIALAGAFLLTVASKSRA
jgi:VanZ family protein